MKTISMTAGGGKTALGQHTGRARARLMPSWRDFGGEKLLRGLLVLTAVAGLGYGCVCVVNLVQSCALFGVRVAQALP